MRLVAPIALGLLAGCGPAQQSAASLAGDPDLAKPAADDCAMAKAVVSAVHAASDDKHWESGSGVENMTLAAHSKVINPADFAGISDDEAANLNGKAPADWRWCPGMSAFVSGFGWKAMGDDFPLAALSLSLPAVNKTGDEAVMYEAFLAEKGGNGVLGLAKGPWLVTLHKGPNGAWTVTKRDDLKKFY
jgi:hypothetical protein